MPGCPVGLSRADAPAFLAFINGDATLTSQCEAIFDQQCFVETFSCFASTRDCVDHTCTIVNRDPVLGCSWTLTEPLRITVDDYYASLANHCEDVSDCTRVASAITRNDQTCWNGCSFAVSVSEASAFADFQATDNILKPAGE